MRTEQSGVWTGEKCPSVHALKFRLKKLFLLLFVVSFLLCASEQEKQLRLLRGCLSVSLFISLLGKLPSFLCVRWRTYHRRPSGQHNAKQTSTPPVWHLCAVIAALPLGKINYFSNRLVSATLDDITHSNLPAPEKHIFPVERHNETDACKSADRTPKSANKVTSFYLFV